MRDARHGGARGEGLAGVFGGEREVADGGEEMGVLEEGLEEIADAVEQEERAGGEAVD